MTRPPHLACAHWDDRADASTPPSPLWGRPRAGARRVIPRALAGQTLGTTVSRVGENTVGPPPAPASMVAPDVGMFAFHSRLNT